MSCVAGVAVAALQSVRSRANAGLPRVEPRKLRRTDLEVVAVNQGFVVGPPPRALAMHRAYALARAVLGHAPERAGARRLHAGARPAGHAAPSALGYPRLVLVAWTSQERHKNQSKRHPLLCLPAPERRRRSRAPLGVDTAFVIAFQSLPSSPHLLRFLHPYFTTATSRAPVSCTRTARRRHRAAPGPQATPSAAGHHPDHLNTAGAQESNHR
jgi:hypothetical protein